MNVRARKVRQDPADSEWSEDVRTGKSMTSQHFAQCDTGVKYIPSPNEIELACRKIRRKWDASEEQKRRVVQQKEVEIVWVKT